MKPSQLQRSQISTVLMAQFPTIKTDLILNDIEIEVSRKTRRIKQVYESNMGQKILLFSLRTSDGRFLPSMEGARRILQSGYKGNRVFMNEESVPFVSKGKSAFCKHVIKVDENIYPQSEVFLVDPQGNLIAVGTSVQPGYAMLQLQSGIAVKPRQHK
ncbi:MAG: PUA domain-containing protein [Candidatus Kariarchaeaceae archaeon]